MSDRHPATINDSVVIFNKITDNVISDYNVLTMFTNYARLS